LPERSREAQDARRGVRTGFAPESSVTLPLARRTSCFHSPSTNITEPVAVSVGGA